MVREDVYNPETKIVTFKSIGSIYEIILWFDYYSNIMVEHYETETTSFDIVSLKWVFQLIMSKLEYEN